MVTIKFTQAIPIGSDQTLDRLIYLADKWCISIATD